MTTYKKQSHTARVLAAMATEYKIQAKTEDTDGKLHDSKRIVELTDDYLRWLADQRQK